MEVASHTRYAVDYNTDRFHFPIPGQICYFVASGSTIAGEEELYENIYLVKYIKESENEKNGNVGWFVILTLQILDEETGTAATDEFGVELKFLTPAVYFDSQCHPMWRPRFARAIKVEAKPEPSNADIMSVVALSQVRFHDIEQRLAQLTTQIDRLIAAKSI